MTNLVKSLRKKGKYLDEDLIAYILYETLKVNITCFDMFVFNKPAKFCGMLKSFKLNVLFLFYLLGN